MKKNLSLFVVFLVAASASAAAGASAVSSAAPSSTPNQCLAVEQPPLAAPEVAALFLSSCTAQATNCDLSCSGTSQCFAGLCSVRCDGQTQWCCDTSGMWCFGGESGAAGACIYCQCLLYGAQNPEECSEIVCGSG